MTLFTKVLPVALLATLAVPNNPLMPGHARADAPAHPLPPGPPPPPPGMMGMGMMGMMHHPHGTVLNFSTHGVAKAVPTVLTLNFTAYSQSTSPAQAQATLNQEVEGAMKLAAGQTDISTVAGNYTLTQDYSEHGPRHWSARQELSLRGTDAPRLLKLAEKIQNQGLALEGMDWSFDDATKEKLLDSARSQALAKIRPQAEADAKALGLQLRGLMQVGIFDESFNPFPHPLMLAKAARFSAPVPPQSTPDEQSVRVTVQVKAMLGRPHSGKDIDREGPDALPPHPDTRHPF
ncbi:SIMPL domain-containing protein [Oecophyllibacter saccharovorans]|uniref:SIMPL domain-containing protein n=1 Tax=Oecophyllibacter saccharovorans TaxID=2558360 RepID=UPI001166BAA8|nr:SIMPL domain-containing protein [Oecophyllibacter saccharovorans]TPW35103.1 DUF541 domain-containing protein [Oecophyllibacter saccharovorans]